MKNNILKIFYIFLFTCVSLHIFVLNLIVFDSSFSGIDNAFYVFHLNLWMSMEAFDISWIVLGIFLFDFYYHTFFIEGSWKINRIIVVIISIIFSIIILLIKSLYTYHNLRMIFDSFVQLYKCLMVGMGYFLIIYAVLKKIFFIKTDLGEI